MPRLSHDQLIKTALSRPSVKAEYDTLNKEFELLEEMIKARLQARQEKLRKR